MSRVEIPAGFDATLARDPQVLHRCAQMAEEAAPIAHRIAREHRVTGELEESIEVDGTRLQTTDPFGHIKEWGAAHMAPIAALRTAAEQVGARSVDDG